eukprot:scaffold79584_cov31-Tisochrysis_lutea.AAC.3
MRLSPGVARGVVAAFAASTIISAGVASVDRVFGVLDSTADELADLLGVDEVSPALAQAVRATAPLYTRLKAISPSCTEGLYPEFSQMLDFNDCLLLPERVIWRGGLKPPLVVSQTMEMSTLWKQSTGSSIWGGGLVLVREMESLGEAFWKGKRVLELGSGTGLGAITAAKLGAASATATDRDTLVLELAQRNARTNLGAANAAAVFNTDLLEWGGSPDVAQARVAAISGFPFDFLIGSDLTYNRDGWIPLAQTLRATRAPALLTASERRPNELAELEAFFQQQSFVFRRIHSPMTRGYASGIAVYWLDASTPELPSIIEPAARGPVTIPSSDYSGAH